MERLPTVPELSGDLRASRDAIDGAVAARRHLRRRTRRRDPDRQKKIASQLSNLERHGSILRSHLKRSDYHPERPYTAADRVLIKRLLREARYQRRQLKKMVPHDELI